MASEYVTIGELVRLTETRYSTLKFYTEEGFLPFVQEGSNLTRRYPREKTVERIAYIKGLRDQKKTIPQIIQEQIIKVDGVAEARRFFNIPFAAVEEALSNAVYHKGYDVREPIEVRVEPDRMIIVSHPGADRSISQEGLREYRVFSRRYRNRRIGEFLKEMHLTEGRNTGFRKIRNALRNNGSPEPLFETDEERTYFATTLFFHPDFVGSETDERENDRINDRINDPINDRNMEKFSAHDWAVFEIIQQNPDLTVALIASQLGVSESTVRRSIRKLRSNGFIQREGSNKKGIWVILKQ